MAIRAEDIKVLQAQNLHYSVLPEITARYQHDQLFGSPLNFNIYQESTHFYRDLPQHTEDDPLRNIARVHLEPSISLPWHIPEAEITTEGKVYYTFYDRTITGENQHVRIIPQFKRKLSCNLKAMTLGLIRLTTKH